MADEMTAQQLKLAIADAKRRRDHQTARELAREADERFPRDYELTCRVCGFVPPRRVTSPKKYRAAWMCLMCIREQERYADREQPSEPLTWTAEN